MAGINPEVTGKKPGQTPGQAPSKAPSKRAPPSKRRRIMFRKEVMEFFKCSNPTIWNWVRKKGFPRPLIVEGRDAWWEDEILAWVDSKPRRRFKGDPATTDDNAEEASRG
jgi:predicted DNA-binding transcriptional regulator AlpA